MYGTGLVMETSGSTQTCRSPEASDVSVCVVGNGAASEAGTIPTATGTVLVSGGARRDVCSFHGSGALRVGYVESWMGDRRRVRLARFLIAVTTRANGRAERGSDEAHFVPAERKSPGACARRDHVGDGRVAEWLGHGSYYLLGWSGDGAVPARRGRS